MTDVKTLLNLEQLKVNFANYKYSYLFVLLSAISGIAVQTNH